MRDIQTNAPLQQTGFQEKIVSAFEQSLTEEQRFLQDVITGKIKLIPHEEVMEKLEYVLKNGLQRK
ncbi:hypothetical protein ACT2CV_01515 [Pasteurellaceae bacterium 22721_9_1]